MKRLFFKLMALCLVLSITACGGKSTEKGQDEAEVTSAQELETKETPTEEKVSLAIQSADDFTPFKVVSLTSPKSMISANGPFSCVSNTVRQGVADESSVTYVFTRNAEGVYENNQKMVYPDGSAYNVYYNSDEQDAYYYVSSPEGAMRYGKNQEMRDFANHSIFGYEADDIKIASVTKEGGIYVVIVEDYVDGELAETDTLYFEETTGKLQKSKLHYSGDDGAGGQYNVDNVIEFTYHDQFDADLTAKKECEKVYADVSESDELSFSTVDIDGNDVTNDIIKGSKLVLLNLWEPWCGPCVREMPDLEKLYKKYKDQGFLILGVYTTFEMDDDAKDVVSSNKISYPILKADRNLMIYEQDYVPASYLFDGDGKLIEDEPIRGSKSYEDWEAIILYYLNK